MNREKFNRVISMITLMSVLLTPGIRKNTNNRVFNSSKYLITNDIKEYLDNNMIPQGLTLINNAILVSAYSENENSKIYVYDKNGNVCNKVILDTNSHVGGISYDKNNELVWVTDIDASVSAYSKDDILYSSYAYPKYKHLYIGKDLVNHNGNEVTSYLVYYDDRLYVGNFNVNSNGMIKEYAIDLDDDVITLSNINAFVVPNKVQGVTFYNTNDKEYMALSISYGRFNYSYLNIYEFNENINDYTKVNHVSYQMPSMMEQVIADNDSIMILFESKSYKNSIDNNFISVLDIKTNELYRYCCFEFINQDRISKEENETDKITTQIKKLKKVLA